MFKNKLSAISISVSMALLCGCGGGGSATAIVPAPLTLGGVAAVGTPIVGGTINVVCAGGSPLSNTMSTLSTGGAWSVTLSGQTFPCAVEVSGGTINGVANATNYHSIATTAGTVNVTPLTDLIVANLAGTATPSTWFAGVTPTILSAVTPTQVTLALANVAAALPALPSITSTNNPLTAVFTPVSGNVNDDILTALKTAIANAGGVTYASLLTNISTTTVVTPNPPAGFAAAMTTAFNGTVSGGTPSVQGVYVGTNSVGKTVNTLVLEDGSFWTMYGVTVGNVLGIQGVATGTATGSSLNFTMAFTDFYAPGNSPVSGSGSGTYTGTSITGTQIENGQLSSFTLTAPSSSTYIYNTPAVNSKVTGAWSGSLLDGETGTVNILANGTFTSTSSLGCSSSGTFVPRPSGVNVFNVSLTFGPSPCVLANQAVSGIALTYPLNNNTHQLIVGLDTASHNVGTAFFAIR